MTIKTPAAAACLLLAAASSSQAATFDFFWSAADPTPSVYSDDPSVRAVGTFDLDVESGAFGNANISNIMIDVTGDNVFDFTLNAFNRPTTGTISGDEYRPKDFIPKRRHIAGDGTHRMQNAAHWDGVQLVTQVK